MSPAPDAVFTIAPARCFCMTGISYFRQWKTLVRFSAITAFQSAVVI